MVSLDRQTWSGWRRLPLIVGTCCYFSALGHVQAFLAAPCLSSIGSPCGGSITLWESSSSAASLSDEIFAAGLETSPRDDSSDDSHGKRELELKSVDLMATLILDKIVAISTNETQHDHLPEVEQRDSASPSIVRGKFIDLSCRPVGEKRLEALFYHSSVQKAESEIILGAISSLHSLLVLGMNYGLSGTPAQFERWMSHLPEPGEVFQDGREYMEWDAASTSRLKFRNERSGGLQLLARLKKKQSPQGAFDLLVSLGVWSKHEDLALLRSGFPIRFSKAEVESSQELLRSPCLDPDSMLGIRKDLRNMKVFTIDGPSTSEIDDGVACEIYEGENGLEKMRLWIHIADADARVPRESITFLGAKIRATSHYLPQMSIPMFPLELSNQMSLTAQQDSFALSLGVELAEDGSIIDSSIVVCPSLVRVDYRLSYDEVDDMLDDGIAYREEWELGAMFSAAMKRRKYRIRNGSSEGFIPKQIPQFHVSSFEDEKELDGMGVTINIHTSHNGGSNQSSAPDEASIEKSEILFEEPVSSASVLVTEMMILAGEAIGRWKLYLDKTDAHEPGSPGTKGNPLRLAFRSQPKPDFRSRSREKRIMEDLLFNNVGGGFCHSWYARRFLSPVVVDEVSRPHSGLGLECYSQWTSPIRRFGDFQVHCAIKRYLRRRKVINMIEQGEDVPSGITALDLGVNCSMTHDHFKEALAATRSLDQDIDYSERTAWLRAAKTLQKTSERYWMLEYIRRIKQKEPEKIFEVLSLGCIDPSRRQYAIYVYELGLEWRYVSPVSSLQAGVRFKVQVGSVLPRNGQLSFVRIHL